MRHRLHIALATCSALPELDSDDRLLLEPLHNLGAEVATPIWDDAHADWSAYDLVVIRDTWDYAERRREFLAWALDVPRLVNPADIVVWNTDKRYLADLAAAGVPVVPTTWLAPGGAVILPPAGRHVLKPAVGAGSIDAAVYSLHDEHEATIARDHVVRLLGADRAVMIQPYMDAIEQRGETALLFFGGRFSHAISKGPLLSGEHAPGPGGLYMSEQITRGSPALRNVTSPPAPWRLSRAASSASSTLELTWFPTPLGIRCSSSSS